MSIPTQLGAPRALAAPRDPDDFYAVARSRAEAKLSVKWVAIFVAGLALATGIAGYVGWQLSLSDLSSLAPPPAGGNAPAPLSAPVRQVALPATGDPRAADTKRVTTQSISVTPPPAAAPSPAASAPAEVVRPADPATMRDDVARVPMPPPRPRPRGLAAPAASATAVPMPPVRPTDTQTPRGLAAIRPATETFWGASD